jgi:REP element-mobilizing transposase RayT
MEQTAYSMDEAGRRAVLESLIERCTERGRVLLAANVRTNHVHVIVGGEATPERIMNDLKSYSAGLGMEAHDGSQREKLF